MGVYNAYFFMLIPTIFHHHSRGEIKCYYIAGEGLGLLRRYFPKYERTREIALELKRLANEEPFPELQQQRHPLTQESKSINEIINIKEQNGEILISGRELHEFLEVGSDYTDWMKRMIAYGFEEDEEFTLLKNKEGKVWVHDHALKIDMAKEIAMLQRTDKGKEARKYFIDCEKQLKSQTPLLPTTYKDTLVALVAEVEAKEQLQAVNEKQQQRIEYQHSQISQQKREIEVMKPKSAYCDMVVEANGAVPITIIAKDYGMCDTIMGKVLHKCSVR